MRLAAKTRATAGSTTVMLGGTVTGRGMELRLRMRFGGAFDGDYRGAFGSKSVPSEAVTVSSSMNSSSSCGAADIQTGANDMRCIGVGPRSRKAFKWMGER